MRDLFQSLRDLFPRRGSADPDFGFIVPVLDLAPAAPDLPARAGLSPAVTLGATLTPIETAAARPDAEVRTIAARGIAVEDGPHVDLGSASTNSFLITPPARLPAGVSFDRESGRFELDPSNVVFQSLGAGEFATIVVHYTAFDGVSTRQATVTWVVEGRNDAPVARADKVVGLSEHGVTALNVTARTIATSTTMRSPSCAGRSPRKAASSATAKATSSSIRARPSMRSAPGRPLR